jgi:hypothetical protein
MSAAPPVVRSALTAALLKRGICRALDQLGYASLIEFPLINGRRADVLGLGKSGDLLIVEIKSSVADFRADRKWTTYRDFADRLYFAVPSHLPQGLIPEECGLMVADPLRRSPNPRRTHYTAQFQPPPRYDLAFCAHRGGAAAPVH